MRRTSGLARGVARSYRRDRAVARAAGMGWPLFMRVWVRSWIIATRVRSPEEARSEGYAYGARMAKRRKGSGG